jgi:hypothetical protein
VLALPFLDRAALPALASCVRWIRGREPSWWWLLVLSLAAAVVGLVIAWALVLVAEAAGSSSARDQNAFGHSPLCLFLSCSQWA